MPLMQLTEIVQVQNLVQNLPATTNMSLSWRNWDVDGVRWSGSPSNSFVSAVFPVQKKNAVYIGWHKKSI